MKLSWPTLLMIAGSLQLIAFAVHSAVSRSKFPKKGLRRSERMLMISAVVAALASLAVMDIRTHWRPKAIVVQSSASTSTAQGSCASIEAGMAESEVTTLLGPPDQRINDEETRGPEAAVLLYKGSRCAVKMLAGRVEVVE
jgi:hypothetical protein